MRRLLAAGGRRRFLAALLVAAPAFAGAAEDGWSQLSDGSVALMRHADAPGIGDPPGFRLDDCRTQRNLSEAGRAQARRIGEQFARRGIAVAAVVTSRWCRTRETAELAFPGKVRDEALFDSFFEDREREPARTAAARALIERWRGPGVLVVVTHQVNISALTGAGASTGEAVVVRPGESGMKVLARLRP